MFQASTLLKDLSRFGIELITGTPCSMLTSLIEEAIASTDITYVGTANEGEAIAIAAGAQLGGKRSMTMFQNSGLGNAINPLTSLALPFQIPMLILTTWRGDPGSEDEPQHQLMGQITPEMLKLMQIPCEEISEKYAELSPALDRAIAHMEKQRGPYALLLKSDILRTTPAVAVAALTTRCIEKLCPSWEDHERWEQDDALSLIQTATGEDDVIIATTGYTGRALFALEDRPNQFYMVGSMGCASSVGLGLALACPKKRIVVLDGDGALLMHLGALATMGHIKPKNLIHILLDNSANDSTGGQPTPAVDFATMAQAAGYSKVVRITDLEALEIELQETWNELAFLHVRTMPRENRDLPRPSLKPCEVANRLREWLS